ncbi:two-component system, LytTR family, response regulator [Pararobbsia alpina]|uniref:LytR/AlgR family response regulator transcription factor n=1 Tax=Pararobbsia alpina TaxID=621374 RepID=UPI0039A66EF2
MRALIVDDEAPARSKLRRMLGAYDDIEIVGEAVDGVNALTLAETLRPDVMFVDVQMPELDGFDVAASLPETGPALVFVTAFDQYALRAFETHACDYLLKPVEPERLERTIQRLRGVIVTAEATTRAASRAASLPARTGIPPTRLVIADQKQTHIVQCADIEWLEAADNYVTLHVAGRSLLMRRTLASLLDDLGTGFIRVHRSAAVALSAVQAIRPKGKGDAIVVLRSGTEVACSRQHREALVERLNGSLSDAGPPGRT